MVTNPGDPDEEGFHQEDWVWDANDCSPDVMLSKDRCAAYFHINSFMESKGTAGVRGTRGFSHGQHYWEVTLLEPAYGTSLMMGVCTKRALLHTDQYNFVDLIGMDEHSWGLSYKGTVHHNGKSWHFCDPFYEAFTVIGLHLNMYNGTLTFYKNGQCLGVAFSGLNKLGDKLYPVISSTAADTELEVGVRSSRYLSLQEECSATIAHSLRRPADTGELPLPPILKQHIQEMM